MGKYVITPFSNGFKGKMVLPFCATAVIFFGAGLVCMSPHKERRFSIAPG